MAPARNLVESPMPSSLPEPRSAHVGLSFVQFVLIIAAMQGLGGLAIDAMLPNLPAIGVALGVGDENKRQLIITSYLLGFGAAQIVYGSLADRFGRRPVLLTGIALYIVFSACAAMARSFEVLLLARVLQGVGAAATRVLPVSIVRDCYDGRGMARVLSLVSMVFMGVPVLAPTLGQSLLHVGPWPLIFGVLALIGACVFVWVFFKLPETLHPQDRQPISQGRIARSFRLAATNRTAACYMVAQTALFGAVLGFIGSSEQVFADAFHAADVFPLVFAIAASFIAIAGLLNAKLVVRIGMRRLAHAGLLGFIAVAALHLAVALSGRETLVIFAAFQALQMLAFGFTSGNFSAMAMEPMGHIAGVASSFQGVVSTVGGSLIGFVIGQQFNGTAAPVVAGYLVCSLVSLAAVLIAEHGRLFRPHQAMVIPIRAG